MTPEDREMLIRIDERTNNIIKAINVIECQPSECNKKFVSQDEFKPVKAIAFGTIGVTFSAILVAVVKDWL